MVSNGNLIRSTFLSSLGATTVAVDTPFAATSTIAVIAPFSGSDRGIGEKLVAGARAAVDDANRIRGMLDRVFALRTFDDQNAVAAALVNAQFATGDSSVIAVVGHVSSRSTLAAIPTYAAAQMPLIVPVSTDDRITGANYRDVFRLQTKDSAEGALFGRYVAEQYRPKTVRVFVQDADYGADVANGFISALQDRKIPAPYTQFGYRNPDFDRVVDEALTVKPDFVFLAGTVGDMGGILKALRAKGYTGPIGASQGFFDARTAQLGAAANDLVISTSTPYLPLAPSTQRARSDFEARYGPIDPVSLFGYAAAQVIINVVKRTGAQARNAVLSALALGAPIDTIAGTFTFGPTGDALDPQIYFYSVRDGRFSYVRQAHASAFMLK